MSNDEFPLDERGELRTEVGQSLILVGMMIVTIIAPLLIALAF